ncbi:hypothetical protein C4561_00630 [candidate division WWE3 bacterium]|jgi:hypothetical protein|uniref:Laminin G domain-containing protein n=1 Tax=candidate division WWE3 bacterium TaxID=2053526 RepID=A0A3A4ZN80_UNCKA|nr:MAG: hypothetical protein C4561_00630 [candidate division WWE3 bacterium]
MLNKIIKKGLSQVHRLKILKKYFKKYQKVLAPFALGLLIITVPIFIYLARHSKPVEAQWSPAHTAWEKRQKLNITNNSGDELASGTTVAVTVDTLSMANRGVLKENCEDIRIVYTTDDTSHTELDSYTSPSGGGTCHTSGIAKVYFKLQAALTNGASADDYYLYYGNKDAITANNVDTFDVGSTNALLICPFDGTTDCINGDGLEEPTTDTGAGRYTGSKSALNFDGANDFVLFGTSYTTLDNLPEGDFTVEMWLNYNNISYGPAQFIFGTYGCTIDGFRADISGGAITLRVENATTDTVTTTSTTVSGNQWTHVAIVYTSSNKTGRVFINGTEASYSTQTAGVGAYNGDADTFRIGSVACQTGFYRGLMDEFRISNIARYDSNFTPQTIPYLRDDYTKLLLHFDENRNDPRQTGKVFDDSGNGNHGTLGSTTAVENTDPGYISGLVGVDASATNTGKSAGGNTYSGHEGIFIEEVTTNKITNPSFEHSSYVNDWTAGSGLTENENSTSNFSRFGNKSAKLSGYVEGYGFDNAQQVYSGLYLDTSSKRLAQGFQVSSSTSASSIILPMFKSGSSYTTVSMRVEIQSDSGGSPSGTPITNGQSEAVLVSSFTSYTDVTFSFASSPSLTSGTQYYIVLIAYTDVDGTIEQAVLDSDSTVKWLYDYTSATYPNGTYTRMNESNVWTPTASYDYIFSIIDSNPMTLTFSVDAGNTNTHTLSAYVYSQSNVISGTTFLFYGYDVSSSVASLIFNGTEQTTTYKDMGGGWWRLSYTGAAASGVQEFGISVEPGKVIYVDGFQLEEKEHATTYTDGSIGTGYAWTGTEHDSTSTRADTDLTYTKTGNVSTTSGSLSIWVKPMLGDSTMESNHNYNIISMRNNCEGFMLRYSSPGYGDRFEIQKWIDCTTNYTAIYNPSSLSADTWVHLVATWDTTNGISLYGNGAIGTTNSDITEPPSIGNIELGDQYSTDEFWSYSDLRIFDTALTSTQAADIYYSGLVSRSDNIEVDRFSGDKGQDPVGYWHFDECCGTTAHDSSQYGNHLTVSGAEWHAVSPNPNALTVNHLHFDATDDYVYQDWDRDFDFGTEGFTVQGWFQHPSSITGTDTLIARYGTAGWKVYMNSTGNICFGVDDDSSWGPDYSVCSPTSYADSTWHHFDAVKDTSTITLFIDGSQIAQTGSVTLGSLSANAKLYIGIDSDGTSNPWDADIDEVSIYPYAKTENQVKGDITSTPISQAFGMNIYNQLEQGLVAHWDMDENTGTSVSDSSGNSNNSTTWSGDTGWATGKYGSSLSFDGTDDGVRVAETASTDLGATDDSYTVSAWFNTSAEYTDNGTIVNKNANGPAYPFWLMITNSTERVAFRIYGGNAGYAESSGAYNDGNWHHAVGVRNTNTDKVYLYIDGELISTGDDNTTSVASNDDDISIGDDPGISGRSFNGQVDEVRIYNRALSSSEVRDLHNWAPGPAGYWKMDENSAGNGVTLKDSSGNGNPATTYDGANDSGMKCNTPGKFGTGCEFDNTDDYITIEDSTNFMTDDTDNFSFMFWVYPNTLGVDGFLCKRFSYSTMDWCMGYASSEILMNIGESNADSLFEVDNVTLTTKTWQHVAVTKSGTTYSLYVNGNLKSTDTSAQTWTNSDSFAIGNAQQSTSNAVDGIMDDVKIYNYTRTPAQIVQDMNASHPAPGSPIGSAVAWWKFDEGYGDTARNSGSAGSALDGDLGDSSLTCPQSGTTDCPQWRNDGKFDRALEFEGPAGGTSGTNDDVVRMGASSSVDNMTEFTLSAWINPQSAGEFDFAFIMAKTTPGTDGFRWAINNSAGASNMSFRKMLGTTDLTVASAVNSITFNEWQHVMVTWDGGTASSGVHFYVNGLEVGHDTATEGAGSPLDDSTSTITIGNNQVGGTQTFDGHIDEVKIYNFVLTAEQAKVEYAQGKAQVFGATGTDSSGNPTWASANTYCPSGQGSTCTPPVFHANFDENSDVYVVNVADTTANGTVTGASWTPGKTGTALNFNGTSSRVAFADDSDLDITGDITIATWIYLDTDITSGYKTVLSKGGGPNYYIAVDSSENLSACIGMACLTSNTSLNLNQWYHVVFTMDETTGTSNDNMYLYINGTVDNSSLNYTYGGVSENTQDLDVGVYDSGTDSFSEWWAGKIDEVRLYNYARSAEQIAWEYSRGEPVAWWKFDECSGTTANDSSGNGLNGTITPGASGNTSAGTCGSGTSTEMWNDGTTGKHSASLGFDETDDYVSVTAGASSKLDLDLNPVTISAWVKTTDLTGNKAIVARGLADDPCNGTEGWGLFINDGGNVSLGGFGGSCLDTTESILNDTWTHIVGITNGSTSYIYVNGNLKATGTVDVVASNNNLIIGATRNINNNGYRNFFGGLIDNIRIFNYAMTENQVRSEYSSGAVNFGYD